jgi:site-specific DNA-methyltransferase (adenine-specific)
MLNQLHLLDNQKGIAKLADKSVNLIISDPPYYKIKGDFDFEFKDFQEYLNFMEEQAKLYKRVLADNGSLFVYGHAKNIAYVQVIFDKYFNLENSLVWYKPDSRTKKGIGIYRSFAPSTERVLFYSNEIQRTGLEEIKLDVNNFKSLRNYFEQVQNFIGISLKKINDTLGHRKAEHCFYWNSTQWDLPTQEVYSQLIDKFNINKMICFREYESLRQEYESLRRPFNNIKNYEDVISMNQEMHLYNSFDHDTIKPERLTLDLIETTTKENDLVLIPFGGSGTECVCSMRLKRQWIAFENKKKYFDIAQKRILSEYEKTSLFNSLGGRELQLSA